MTLVAHLSATNAGRALGETAGAWGVKEGTGGTTTLGLGAGLCLNTAAELFWCKLKPRAGSLEIGSALTVLALTLVTLKSSSLSSSMRIS
jgi:hypothetical protein